MQIFFRKHCLLCGASGNDDLCTPCRNSLPYLPFDRCPVCALPAAGRLVCGACLAYPPAFTHTVAAVSYAFPIDAMIHSLKYRANLAMAPILADLLAAQIDQVIFPDFIIPMPLHPVRLRERGFNQALEIARCIAKKTGIALLPDVCKRIKNTVSQTGLPWKEREKNIRGAFACEMDLTGKHIAVLDDVMTTGATLNELTRVLHACRAVKVSGWVVARTL
ncbi:MAG: ComF family protein [Nitrosospira sp.]|nr:ComF family protein [Nitrosospira sp.]